MNIHNNKLNILVKGIVYLPNGFDNTINPSNSVLTEDKNSVVNKGLSFRQKNNRVYSNQKYKQSNFVAD